MTAPVFLHRYCRDHTPERSLCGISLRWGAADPSNAVEAMPVCVVCADLAEAACQDACLAARSEAST
jgi:hypothetical protein